MEIFPTMITPYKKDRTIDYDTAVKYVDWYFENGMTGIFSVCQSSEIFFLSLEEKVKHLSNSSLDLDLLEERARIVLNMAAQDEFILLDEE